MQMQTIYSLDQWSSALKGSVLTIGNFDGVHLGHQKLFHEVAAIAQRLDLKSVVFTFDQHPSRVLRPEKATKRLFDLDDLKQTIAHYHLDYLIIEPFTKQFAAQSAEQFIQSLFTKKINPKLILVGHDFMFGKDRQGSYSLLEKLSKTSDFKVARLEPVLFKGEVVSSSRIRELLFEGAVEEAASLLGRAYYVRGHVVAGDGRGHSLGFATANLQAQSEILPKRGVYITEVRVQGKVYPAVTNVGTKPTFHADHDITVESHILAGEVPLLGHDIEVAFLKRLRGELKFSSAHELIKQIEIDVAAGKNYFGI